jgi:hypothetical protein
LQVVDDSAVAFNFFVQNRNISIPVVYEGFWLLAEARKHQENSAAIVATISVLECVLKPSSGFSI